MELLRHPKISSFTANLVNLISCKIWNVGLSLEWKMLIFTCGFNVEHSRVAVTSHRQIDHRSARAQFPRVVYPFNCEVLTYRVYSDQWRENSLWDSHRGESTETASSYESSLPLIRTHGNSNGCPYENILNDPMSAGDHPLMSDPSH